VILRAFSITSFSAWLVASFLVSTKLCALAITLPFLFTIIAPTGTSCLFFALIA
jgi:hypothetical protein